MIPEFLQAVLWLVCLDNVYLLSLTNTFLFLCPAVTGESPPSLSKELTSSLAGVGDVSFDTDSQFPLDELKIDPLTLDGLHMLNDPDMVLTDPATEDTFRMDRLWSADTRSVGVTLVPGAQPNQSPTGQSCQNRSCREQQLCPVQHVPWVKLVVLSLQRCRPLLPVAPYFTPNPLIATDEQGVSVSLFLSRAPPFLPPKLQRCRFILCTREGVFGGRRGRSAAKGKEILSNVPNCWPLFETGRGKPPLPPHWFGSKALQFCTAALWEGLGGLRRSRRCFVTAASSGETLLPPSICPVCFQVRFLACRPAPSASSGPWANARTWPSGKAAWRPDGLR